METRIVELIWTWIASYGLDFLGEFTKEGLYGKPNSPIREIGIIAEGTNCEAHGIKSASEFLGEYYCEITAPLTDWLDLTDLHAESAEHGPYILRIYTDMARGVVQLYFEEPKLLTHDHATNRIQSVA